MDEQVHQSDDADVLLLSNPHWTPFNGGDMVMDWTTSSSGVAAAFGPDAHHPMHVGYPTNGGTIDITNLKMGTAG